MTAIKSDFEAPKRYTAINDVTGALIISKADAQDAYAHGYDRAFVFPKWINKVKDIMKEHHPDVENWYCFDYECWGSMFEDGLTPSEAVEEEYSNWDNDE